MSNGRSLEVGKLVQLSLARLARRAQLNLVAQDAFVGIKTANDRLLGRREDLGPPLPVFEGEDKGMCGTGDPEIRFNCGDIDDFSCDAIPGETAKFDCGLASDFSCDPNSLFTKVCNFATPFDCAGAAPDSFDCGSGDVAVFDCKEFGCTTGIKFECDEIDFLCGQTFECDGTFDCTAGHIFMCTNDHDCEDSFTCEAKGDPACDNSKGCTAKGAYCADDDGDGVPEPSTAGDFMCGWRGGGADEFDCTDIFLCKGADEFECTSNTTFICGTGGNNDGFQCTGGGEFDCEDQKKFTCSPQIAFLCRGSYSPDPPS